MIALTVAGCPLRDSFQKQVAEALAPVAGVERVALEFDVMSPDERAALTERLRGGVTGRSKGLSLDRGTRVLAVASGKGGVGKSTLSVNLAAAFAQLGRQVGILDADIYGHSIPHMLGITQKPVLVDRMIVPPVTQDLKLMSIGFFLDDNEPVMWRGPMLHRALEQFLTDVHWGELDLLVVDMPPGTGDVSISLGQLLPRAEVVVVTTPQTLAQEVASRAASWRRRRTCACSASIENMTGDVFGSGGGEALAERARRAAARRRSRSTRGCASRATSALPLVAADPSSRPRARSSRSRRRSTAAPRRRRRHRQGAPARLLSAARRVLRSGPDAAAALVGARARAGVPLAYGVITRCADARRPRCGSCSSSRAGRARSGAARRRRTG